MAKRKAVATAVAPKGKRAVDYGLKSSSLTKAKKEEFFSFVMRKRLVPEQIELLKESMDLFYCIHEDIHQQDGLRIIQRLKQRHPQIGISESTFFELSLATDEDAKGCPTQLIVGIFNGSEFFDYWLPEDYRQVFPVDDEKFEKLRHATSITSAWMVPRADYSVACLCHDNYRSTYCVKSFSPLLRAQVIRFAKKVTAHRKLRNSLGTTLRQLLGSCKTIWDLFYLMPEAEGLFIEMQEASDKTPAPCSDTPAADSAATLRKLLSTK